MNAPATVSLDSSMLNLPLRDARAAFMRAYWARHMETFGNDVQAVADHVGCDRASVYYSFKVCDYPLPGRAVKKGGAA